ncbi:MAG: hypothetical protein CMN55_06940, partial [Sneathiella sp.]
DLAGTLKNVNPENVKKIIDDAKGAGDNLKDSLKGGAEKDSGGVKNLLDAAGGLLGGKKN